VAEVGAEGEAQPGAGGEAQPGVLDLYRSVWATALQFIVRYRVAIVVEIGMIALWFVLRTVVSVEGRAYLAWTLLASGIAFVSPSSGLVILLATAPFYEPLKVTKDLGQREVLVAALGLSVAARLVLGGWRRMVWTAPVRLALLLGLATALGVVYTFRHYPVDWAIHAEQTWLATVGGAMILLLVGVWVAAVGGRRFVVAAVVASTIAVALSLVDLLVPDSVSKSPIAWIGFWKDFGPRLGGAVPSPNGMAALAVMPMGVLTAVAVLGRDRRVVRIASAAAAALLLVAMYLTYSRAALLALYMLAVVIAWRIRKRLGQAVLVVGLIVGILLLPKYLQIRGQVGAEAGAVTPDSVLVASDRDRFTAWQAAIAMFEKKPLTGQGFLSYRRLGKSFGDPILGSPHNEWLRFFAEEGILGGAIGLAFLATTLSWLSHARGALGAGILAGVAGYFTMATFNNPFLFIQISAVAFPLLGYALVSNLSAEPAMTAQLEKAAFSSDPAG
jgi:hypothetical protein